VQEFRTRGWLEELALHGRGARARLAAAALCVPVDRATGRADLRAVLAVMGSAADPEAATRARRTVEKVWADPSRREELLHQVWELCRTRPFSADGRRLESRRGWPVDPPPGIAAFLAEPVAEPCEYVPPVRIVWLLGTRTDRNPWWDAEALVEGGLSATDARARETLVALLSDTNLPSLLDQLKHAFHRTISALRFGDHRPPSTFFRPDGVRDHTGAYLLSWEGRPTPLLSIVQANPYLPDHVEPSESALMIVLQRHWDRLDELVEQNGYFAAVALVEAIALPIDNELRDACRRRLRDLPPGAAREALVDYPMYATGWLEARYAAVDAGFVRDERHVRLAYLFATEQWDAYDQADPDGELLRRYCADHWWFCRDELSAAARRGNRPDPVPPVPAPASTPPSPERQRRSGPIGSWPTDPGGGDYGGGGSGSFGGF
jgi:hypothetical protein